jgi:hypothetical protein
LCGGRFGVSKLGSGNNNAAWHPSVLNGYTRDGSL